MKKDKYVAYVGTYTHGSSIGIHLYDLDVEAGRMTERKVIPINNSSYVIKSHNGKYLYSIADEGVEAFKILPDGDLEPINNAVTGGMRGCFLATDQKDRFLFVAGYHDGRVSVLHLNEDGSVGDIADGIFHQGLGGLAERNFRPHVNCVAMTPDEKYLCAVDLGVDQVKLYKLDHNTGRIKLIDILRCELESAPTRLLFSPDGRFAYLICELKNYINVYTYNGTGKSPKFELIQTISTLNKKYERGSAACALRFSPDGNYLICSNAGDDSVGMYKVNHETGELEKICILPISGDYPKDIAIFPDGRHLISLNHESDSITFFTVDYEQGTLVMNGKEVKVDTPNCVLISKIGE
ncbi:lactonase family protein [Diplocloster modestus]|uniref:Lactonase family protein n=1 Tax=Diplocloster modestus TaxID=2850322 RepID=A0ABS6K8N4_9FIRM|nr:lactonase family protein [Diplocloster modestus]MBU9726853.1 lactonase family protein [Diplocloster modestus]